MSAFATIRFYRGQPVFLERHLEKLRLTCTRLGLRLPPDVLFPFEFHGNDGMARFVVTAGDGDFLSPLNEGRIFLTFQGIGNSHAPQNLVFAESTHTLLFSGMKTGNYWPHIAAYRDAQTRQADETILVNSANHVISASLANVFAVIDNTLMTPRVSSGARPGVMRDWVLEQEEVIVSDFHPEQLREASEIFLTNSRYGIAPIEMLEGKPCRDKSLGQKLQSQYTSWLDAS